MRNNPNEGHKEAPKMKTGPKWYDPAAMAKCETSKIVSMNLSGTLANETYHAQEAAWHIQSIGVDKYGPKWNKAEESKKFKNACRVGQEAASAITAATLIDQQACGETPKTAKITLDQQKENIQKLKRVCKNKPN